MGWVSKIDAKPAHTCVKPNERQIEDANVAVGSVWECEGCHTRYQLTGWGHGWGGDQGDYWPEWKVVATPALHHRPQRDLSVDGGHSAAVRDDPSTQPSGGAVEQQWER